MKLRNIVKAAVVLGCAGVLAATFAACGNNEEDPPAVTKTHDPVTLEVDGRPGTYHWHNFVDGKCTMCDETTIFTQDSVAQDDIVTKECDRQGTVEEIKYTTAVYPDYEYADENGLVTKTAWVYLPYGYDAEDTSTKYNLLVLVHGSGLNEGYWFAKGSYADESQQSIYLSGGNGTANLLDTMMKDGTAEKTIVVTPTFYMPGEDGTTANTGNAADTSNFAEELKGDLLPYMALNYNTYAEVNEEMTDEEMTAALVAARDHQAYAGLSLGSMISFTSIWAECIDVFSYIGSFSGAVSVEQAEALAETKNTEFADYDIHYWYVSLGTSETNMVYPGDPFGDYRAMLGAVEGLQSGSDLSAGDNCQYMVCNKTGHNYPSWITSLYNCMQVFFKA